jgi:hypothetical protein
MTKLFLEAKKNYNLHQWAFGSFYPNLFAI